MPSSVMIVSADPTALVLPAVGIAVAGFSDNALTTRAFAARHGHHVAADAELAATDLASGALHGFPVSCSGSRTTIADAMHARTQLYSLVTLAAVAAVPIGAREVHAAFPTAAPAALVIYAALRLIDVAELRRIGRFRRSELVLALATLVAVLALGERYGVVPGLTGMHDIDDYPRAEPVPGLLIYRYDAPLCFANAEDFRRRALAARDQRVALDAAGSTTRIGAQYLYPTLPTAIAAYHAAQRDSP
ncbi:hypothetical protein IU444_06835 [Nocardia farcinica]|nr:hypothetical protein [Nocardia farcinica]PEH75990.1 hypothetical protein CRM89_08330 [Nocardia sp. FDAARGOS_372]MBF6292834.1 hypothetical protein [Nocardia farcinica]MBF6309734.1 hypothetical protein [Nocardia farcinica]MBF6379129.1 hypothetical protein [Nocardia farcinica]